MTERIYLVRRPHPVAVGDEVEYLEYIEVEPGFLEQMKRGLIDDWSIDGEEN